MKKHKWLKIKKIEEDGDESKLRVGDIFLTGNSTIAQIETKVIGDQITYYKIIKKGDKNIEYEMMFDILEED